MKTRRTGRRAWLTLLLALLFCAVAPLTVSADIGPKPSVQLTFEGLSDEPYYVTLLSKTDGYGPYGAYSTDRDDRPEDPAALAAWERFVAYEDPDGFYFLQYFREAENDHYAWTYYPPDPFKILLYFPESDRLVAVDGMYERYAFDSYFTVRFENGVGTAVEKSYDYTGEVVSFLVRLALTVAIEVALALAFGYRRRALGLIAATNAVTQLLLNAALSLMWWQQGFHLWFFFGAGFFGLGLELAVFLIEAVVYAWGIRRVDQTAPPRRRRAVIYAAVANVVSFAVGLLLGLWIPALF